MIHFVLFECIWQNFQFITTGSNFSLCSKFGANALQN